MIIVLLHNYIQSLQITLLSFIHFISLFLHMEIYMDIRQCLIHFVFNDIPTTDCKDSRKQ